MKNRTDKQIKARIKDLKKERSVIREFSAFGDNNWRNIDEEIIILNQYLDGEIDELDFEQMLEDTEMELEGNPDKFMECPVKQAIDFIQGY